jgi:exportin-T
MDPALDQITQAILIASDPSQTSLHSQALEYLSSIQQNAQMTWRWALALFVERGPEGSERKYPPQARFFALRVLEDFLDNRLVQSAVRGCVLNS